MEDSDDALAGINSIIVSFLPWLSHFICILSLSACCCVRCVCASCRFQQFMTMHNRVYADANETARRFDNFLAHAEVVAEVNIKITTRPHTESIIILENATHFAFVRAHPSGCMCGVCLLDHLKQPLKNSLTRGKKQLPCNFISEEATHPILFSFFRLFPALPAS